MNPSSIWNTVKGRDSCRPGRYSQSPRSSGPVPTLGAAFEVGSNSQSRGTEQWREALAHSALPLCSKRIV